MRCISEWRIAGSHVNRPIVIRVGDPIYSDSPVTVCLGGEHVSFTDAGILEIIEALQLARAVYQAD